MQTGRLHVLINKGWYAVMKYEHPACTRPAADRYAPTATSAGPSLLWVGGTYSVANVQQSGHRTCIVLIARQLVRHILGAKPHVEILLAHFALVQLVDMVLQLVRIQACCVLCLLGRQAASSKQQQDHHLATSHWLFKQHSQTDKRSWQEASVTHHGTSPSTLNTQKSSMIAIT